LRAGTASRPCRRGDRGTPDDSPGRVEPLSCYQAEVDGLWSVIGRLVDLFAPQECANYFTATSYDAA
jgi:hypothetical protein